jgi:hypothetical protein
MSIKNTSTNIMLQTSASSELRSQAVSVYMLAMRGGGALGSLATGFSLSLLGIREALLVNGLLAILVQALIGRRWDRMPDPRQPRCSVTRSRPASCLLTVGVMWTHHGVPSCVHCEDGGWTNRVEPGSLLWSTAGAFASEPCVCAAVFRPLGRPGG